MKKARFYPIYVLLTVIFIVLKMTGTIDWSWFWVTFPVCFVWYFIVAMSAVVAVWTAIITFFATFVGIVGKVWDMLKTE